MIERKKVLIVGGPHSGKTMLFRSLLGHPFNDEYVPDETALFAFQIISTVKSEYKHLPPQSFHICCAPGSILRSDKACDYYFKSPEIILMCFDFSHLLEEERLNEMTRYVLKNLSKFHDYHNE